MVYPETSNWFSPEVGLRYFRNYNQTGIKSQKILRSYIRLNCLTLGSSFCRFSYI